MNINDIKEDAPKVPDKLEALFAYQSALLMTYNQIEEANGLLFTDDVPVDIDDPMGQATLKSFAWRITEELGEAMNCLKNKPWKQTPMPTDKLHFIEELADALHFFLDLLILTGLNAETLYQLYYKKMRVNQFRQESGY